MNSRANAVTIGAGGFGKVRVHYSNKYKRMVIEKEVGPNFLRLRKDNELRLKKILDDYKNCVEMLKKETVFMTLLKMEKIDCCVEILGVETHPFRIVMEYCEGGDLRNVLDNYEVPVGDKVTLISQILIAIKRIHEFGIIHGDLKCQNIFLVKKYIPGDFKNIKIKIGDFGLSEVGGKLVFGGTEGFQAPETRYTGGSFASDIYSIGKVMLEIMTELPVYKIAELNIERLSTIKDTLPKLLDVSNFYSVVIPCLNIDPKKRPTAKQLFDIFHSMMGLWLIGTKMNNLALDDYKIGDKVPVDTHPHALILSNAKMRNYPPNSMWYCNICGDKKPLLNNTHSFHCHKCSYDLCLICIKKHNYKYLNQKMMEKANKDTKVYVIQHPDFLKLSGEQERNYKDETWICDICKTEFNCFIYSFHCKKCQYDVCLNCYDKNKEFRKEEHCCCIVF